MHPLQVHINQILDLGNEILSELEKEEPDIKIIQHLYRQRSEEVNRLGQWSDSEIAACAKEEKATSKNLFYRLNQLEQKISRHLAALSQRRLKALSDIQTHNKARKSYSSASARTKFIDIKSYS